VYRKVAIRPFSPEDEADLFNLARDAFADRRGWRDDRTLLVLESDLVFVAECGGSTAGYAAVERVGEALRVEHLLVSLAHDDEQVEAQLLDHVEGYAISVGAGRLQVVVETDNERALAFYRQRGFAPIGGELFELVLPQRS
jgi:ribosomal protein S18 acetylase RimI-like enzyme